MNVRSNLRLLPLLVAAASCSLAASLLAADEKPSSPPEGFEALFNGKDLSNWRGQIAEDPRDIAKITKGLSHGQVRQKQKEADDLTFRHWKAENGSIYYDGTRRIGNIETREHFGDFELFIDWKIPKGGDSGIFPRNMPQVQIWDPAGGKRNVVGSGGLDNNGPNIPPLKKADNPVGQWNTFYIKMMGDTIWVKLNGETVIDGKKKGNYWKEFQEPLPKKGPIVLQSHGSELWFRNVYIRRLDAAGEDLSCLKQDAGTSAAKLIYAQLQQQAYAALDRRKKELEKLETPEQIHEHQARLQRFFVRQLGGFAERTPLNAQVVGKLSGDGYHVEKVIFESRPNHHVTAVLYLPDGTGPFPGVAVSSGHSRTAKTAEYNQRFGIALAKGGMAALCYDPIGQGERSQILTDDAQPQHKSTVHEHTLVGIGSILVGRNTASYRIWDGIRAIDYLTSRPDIDAKRIGFTGCSGGGTLTSYVMALDKRVLCAAPACYLTTFRRLIETIGPQDAEQNIFGQIEFGMDQPDYVLMRAPRPTLISSTTGDFFDIGGSWDAYRQAKRLYWRLGHPERMALVEGAGGHGVPKQNLAAIVRWMRRWLLDKDDEWELPEITPHPMEDLLCTKKGQVLTLSSEKSVFDLNAEFEQRLEKKRREFWEKTARQEALRAVRETVGVWLLDEIGKLRMEKTGRVQRDGYHIDKLVLYTDSGVPIPALTFHPKDPQDDAYLYLHDGGKLADAALGGPIEQLVSQGHVVVAVDLRGFGETAPDKNDKRLGYRFSEQTFFVAYLLGQSIVGLRTEDTLACGRWVANYETDEPRNVHLVGVGTAGIAALHAAALQGDLFATLTLRGTLPSWTDLVGRPVPTDRIIDTVHGALAFYDLPDLVRTLDPKRVVIEAGK